MAGVAVGLTACGGDDDPPVVEAPEGIDGLVIERSASANHVLSEVGYPSPAPSGGDHSPFVLNCGVYGEPVPPELAVHALEHGAVWIAIGETAPEGTAEAAAELAGRFDKVFVAPVEGLTGAVELVAWERRLPLPDLTDERAEAFLETFVGAASSPEPNAACAGVGTPPAAPDLPSG